MDTYMLYGFRMNGENRITLNRSHKRMLSDSFDILEFIRNTSDDDMIKLFNLMRIVNDNQRPSESEWNDISKSYLSATANVDKNMTWSEITKRTEGNTRIMKHCIENNCSYYMIDNSSLMNNAQLIRYAFVIDITNKCIEFYKGMMSKPNGSSTKRTMLSDNPVTKHLWTVNHKPCELVTTLSFDEIRTTMYLNVIRERIVETCLR